MKSIMAAAFAVVAGNLAVTTSAVAQYGQATNSSAQAPQADPAAGQTVAAQRTINISKSAQKAVVALQEAIKTGDMATINAHVSAAQAAAKTADERYYIANLQYEAAVAAKDHATIAAAIETMLASGGAQPGDLHSLYMNLGKTYANLQQHDRAAAAFERAIQHNPNDLQGTILLAETRNSQGRPADAVALIQKGIAMASTGGQRAREDWHKRAVALAFNNNLPVAVALSREWVEDYPTSANWRDALRIYRKFHSPDEPTELDMFRLARATNALQGDGDFYQYAEGLARKGLPGEAKTVLDEAVRANAIDPSKPMFRDLMAVLATRAEGDRATLDPSAAKARAGANAGPAISTADAYYGYGDYAKAADLYRAALGKTGADPNLINLRLGMALARAGDKAGATAALNAVTGPRAELAKFWLSYVQTQS